MEIGEHQLALAHQRIFWFDRLLHLHDHVGLGIDKLHVLQNLGASLHVVFIAEATAFASRMLHQYLMSVLHHLSNARRGHAHAVLVVLNLLWNTDSHNIIIGLVKHNIVCGGKFTKKNDRLYRISQKIFHYASMNHILRRNGIVTGFQRSAHWAEKTTYRRAKK